MQCESYIGFTGTTFISGIAFTIGIGHCEQTIITACKRSLGQGNVFTGVCLSTGGEGFGFPVCITGHMTRASAQHPLPVGRPGGVRPTTPTPMLAPCGILRDTVNKRVVRIRLECILVIYSQ